MTATTARVRAAELRGTGWINTDRPLTLAGLGGKVVVLDFWTFCCINCLHIIEELRPLEERFGDRLVVIGVHSPSSLTRLTTPLSNVPFVVIASIIRCSTTPTCRPGSSTASVPGPRWW